MNAYPNPPKEDFCDLPVCLACGKQDADLQECAGGCSSVLHRRCADRCEACGQVVCQVCVDHWQDYPHCPSCLLEEKGIDERTMELEEECTLP